MKNERLQAVIDHFNTDDLIRFFREANNFAESKEALDGFDDEKFKNFEKLGEMRFETGEKLVVVSSSVEGGLTERSSKKQQYDKAKKIIQSLNVYEQGIFVFYDRDVSFRFSLIYGTPQGKTRVFSNFRRFTYFVSKEQTNKTFLKQIGEGNFSTLEKIKAGFSVEAVNKEFYSHIAKFFYELTGGEVKKGSKTEKYKRILRLPSTSETNDMIYQEFSVRLIGRIIFCWFLKHKKSKNNIPLIPDSVLSLNAAKQNKQFYHTILEPLFFEVLNTPLQNRKKNILRDSDNIPFLNGGLFEPVPYDDYKGEPLYSLVIPDTWFHQFLEVLEQYNFTIDENSAVDAEVSVDPEMLGRIFENLLAEINPETGETARKATGSYYTPRAIVEYMVDQSLAQYLIEKTKISEKKIHELLSYEHQEVELTEPEKDAVISALDEIKALDPACGSGAFPMGILQKMLLILQKIDPESKKWLEKKLEKIQDSLVKKQMEKKLKNENWDYVHKLGIIQSSIYGVDIQPIAVEISKLRFFLSLIVDENIDDAKPNRGIEPLPNLEFKFAAANALIGLPQMDNKDALITFEDEASIQKLKNLREEYFQSFGQEKQKIIKEFREVQNKMFEFYLKHLSKKQYNAKGQEIKYTKKKQQPETSLTGTLSQWNPFSNNSSGWFDPGWMFGIYGGFDVVIANPPYGFRDVLSSEEKQFFRKTMKIEFPTGDIAELFIVISLSKFVGQNGALTFIIPKKSLYGESWSNVRNIWLENNLRFLMDASQAFENVLLEQVAFGIQKKSRRAGGQISIGVLDSATNSVQVFGGFDITEIFTADMRNAQIYRGLFPKKMIDKIDSQSVQDTSLLLKAVIGISNITKHLTFESDNNYPCVKGIDIFSYGLKRDIRFLKGKIAKQYIGQFRDEKLVAQEIIAHIKNPFPHIQIMIFYDDQGRLLNDTCVEIKPLNDTLHKKFLLAYLQSSFCNWHSYNFIYNRAIRTMHFINYYVTQIPIPKRAVDEPREQIPFIALVDKILAITKDNDYLTNPAKQAKVRDYERQIDALVYKLYELTPEEIEIVEGQG